MSFLLLFCFVSCHRSSFSSSPPSSSLTAFLFVSYHSSFPSLSSFRLCWMSDRRLSLARLPDPITIVSLLLFLLLPSLFVQSCFVFHPPPLSLFDTLALIRLCWMNCRRLYRTISGPDHHQVIAPCISSALLLFCFVSCHPSSSVPSFLILIPLLLSLFLFCLCLSLFFQVVLDELQKTLYCKTSGPDHHHVIAHNVEEASVLFCDVVQVRKRVMLLFY